MASPDSMGIGVFLNKIYYSINQNATKLSQIDPTMTIPSTSADWESLALKMLIEYRKQPEFPLNYQRPSSIFEGQTILMYAIRYKKLRLVEWLLKHGADPTLHHALLAQFNALTYALAPYDLQYDDITIQLLNILLTHGTPILSTAYSMFFLITRDIELSPAYTSIWALLWATDSNVIDIRAISIFLSRKEKFDQKILKQSEKFTMLQQQQQQQVGNQGLSNVAPKPLTLRQSTLQRQSSLVMLDHGKSLDARGNTNTSLGNGGLGNTNNNTIDKQTTQAENDKILSQTSPFYFIWHDIFGPALSSNNEIIKQEALRVATVACLVADRINTNILAFLLQQAPSAFFSSLLSPLDHPLFSANPFPVGWHHYPPVQSVWYEHAEPLECSILHHPFKTLAEGVGKGRSVDLYRVLLARHIGQLNYSVLKAFEMLINARVTLPPLETVSKLLDAASLHPSLGIDILSDIKQGIISFKTLFLTPQQIQSKLHLFGSDGKKIDYDKMAKELEENLDEEREMEKKGAFSSHSTYSKKSLSQLPTSTLNPDIDPKGFASEYRVQLYHEMMTVSLYQEQKAKKLHKDENTNKIDDTRKYTYDTTPTSQEIALHDIISNTILSDILIKLILLMLSLNQDNYLTVLNLLINSSSGLPIEVSLFFILNLTRRFLNSIPVTSHPAITNNSSRDLRYLKNGVDFYGNGEQFDELFDQIEQDQLHHSFLKSSGNNNTTDMAAASSSLSSSDQLLNPQSMTPFEQFLAGKGGIGLSDDDEEEEQKDEEKKKKDEKIDKIKQMTIPEAPQPLRTSKIKVHSKLELFKYKTNNNNNGTDDLLGDIAGTAEGHSLQFSHSFLDLLSSLLQFISTSISTPSDVLIISEYLYSVLNIGLMSKKGLNYRLEGMKKFHFVDHYCPITRVIKPLSMTVLSQLTSSTTTSSTSPQTSSSKSIFPSIYHQYYIIHKMSVLQSFLSHSDLFKIESLALHSPENRKLITKPTLFGPLLYNIFNSFNLTPRQSIQLYHLVFNQQHLLDVYHSDTFFKLLYSTLPHPNTYSTNLFKGILRYCIAKLDQSGNDALYPMVREASPSTFALKLWCFIRFLESNSYHIYEKLYPSTVSKMKIPTKFLSIKDNEQGQIDFIDRQLQKDTKPLVNDGLPMIATPVLDEEWRDGCDFINSNYQWYNLQALFENTILSRQYHDKSSLQDQNDHLLHTPNLNLHFTPTLPLTTEFTTCELYNYYNNRTIYPLQLPWNIINILAQDSNYHLDPYSTYVTHYIHTISMKSLQYTTLSSAFNDTPSFDYGYALLFMGKFLSPDYSTLLSTATDHTAPFRYWTGLYNPTNTRPVEYNESIFSSVHGPGSRSKEGTGGRLGLEGEYIKKMISLGHIDNDLLRFLPSVQLVKEIATITTQISSSLSISYDDVSASTEVYNENYDFIQRSGQNGSNLPFLHKIIQKDHHAKIYSFLLNQIKSHFTPQSPQVPSFGMISEYQSPYLDLNGGYCGVKWGIFNGFDKKYTRSLSHPTSLSLPMPSRNTYHLAPIHQQLTTLLKTPTNIPISIICNELLETKNELTHPQATLDHLFTKTSSFLHSSSFSKFSQSNRTYNMSYWYGTPGLAYDLSNLLHHSDEHPLLTTLITQLGKIYMDKIDMAQAIFSSLNQIGAISVFSPENQSKSTPLPLLKSHPYPLKRSKLFTLDPIEPFQDDRRRRFKQILHNHGYSSTLPSFAGLTRIGKLYQHNDGLYSTGPCLTQKPFCLDSYITSPTNHYSSASLIPTTPINIRLWMRNAATTVFGGSVMGPLCERRINDFDPTQNPPHLAIYRDHFVTQSPLILTSLQRTFIGMLWNRVPSYHFYRSESFDYQILSLLKTLEITWRTVFLQYSSTSPTSLQLSPPQHNYTTTAPTITDYNYLPQFVWDQLFTVLLIGLRPSNLHTRIHTITYAILLYKIQYNSTSRSTSHTAGGESTSKSSQPFFKQGYVSYVLTETPTLDSFPIIHYAQILPLFKSFLQQRPKKDDPLMLPGYWVSCSQGCDGINPYCFFILELLQKYPIFSSFFDLVHINVPRHYTNGLMNLESTGLDGLFLSNGVYLDPNRDQDMAGREDGFINWTKQEDDPKEYSLTALHFWSIIQKVFYTATGGIESTANIHSTRLTALHEFYKNGLSQSEKYIALYPHKHVIHIAFYLYLTSYHPGETPSYQGMSAKAFFMATKYGLSHNYKRASFHGYHNSVNGLDATGGHWDDHKEIIDDIKQKDSTVFENKNSIIEKKPEKLYFSLFQLHQSDLTNFAREDAFNHFDRNVHQHDNIFLGQEVSSATSYDQYCQSFLLPRQKLISNSLNLNQQSAAKGNLLPTPLDFSSPTPHIPMSSILTPTIHDLEPTSTAATNINTSQPLFQNNLISPSQLSPSSILDSSIGELDLFSHNRSLLGDNLDFFAPLSCPFRFKNYALHNPMASIQSILYDGDYSELLEWARPNFYQDLYDQLDEILSSVAKKKPIEDKKEEKNENKDSTLITSSSKENQSQSPLSPFPIHIMEDENLSNSNPIHEIDDEVIVPVSSDDNTPQPIHSFGLPTLTTKLTKSASSSSSSSQLSSSSSSSQIKLLPVSQSTTVVDMDDVTSSLPLAMPTFARQSSSSSITSNGSSSSSSYHLNNDSNPTLSLSLSTTVLNKAESNASLGLGRTNSNLGNNNNIFSGFADSGPNGGNQQNDDDFDNNNQLLSPKSPNQLQSLRQLSLTKQASVLAHGPLDEEDNDDKKNNNIMILAAAPPSSSSLSPPVNVQQENQSQALSQQKITSKWLRALFITNPTCLEFGDFDYNHFAPHHPVTIKILSKIAHLIQENRDERIRLKQEAKVSEVNQALLTADGDSSHIQSAVATKEKKKKNTSATPATATPAAPKTSTSIIPASITNTGTFGNILSKYATNPQKNTKRVKTTEDNDNLPSFAPPQYYDDELDLNFFSLTSFHLNTVVRVGMTHLLRVNNLSSSSSSLRIFSSSHWSAELVQFLSTCFRTKILPLQHHTSILPCLPISPTAWITYETTDMLTCDQVSQHCRLQGSIVSHALVRFIHRSIQLRLQTPPHEHYLDSKIRKTSPLPFLNEITPTLLHGEYSVPPITIGRAMTPYNEHIFTTQYVLELTIQLKHLIAKFNKSLITPALYAAKHVDIKWRDTLDVSIRVLMLKNAVLNWAELLVMKFILNFIPYHESSSHYILSMFTHLRNQPHTSLFYALFLLFVDQPGPNTNIVFENRSIFDWLLHSTYHPALLTSANTVHQIFTPEQLEIINQKALPLNIASLSQQQPIYHSTTYYQVDSPYSYIVDYVPGVTIEEDQVTYTKLLSINSPIPVYRSINLVDLHLMVKLLSIGMQPCTPSRMDNIYHEQCGFFFDFHDTFSNNVNHNGATNSINTNTTSSSLFDEDVLASNNIDQGSSSDSDSSDSDDGFLHGKGSKVLTPGQRRKQQRKMMQQQQQQQKSASSSTTILDANATVEQPSDNSHKVNNKIVYIDTIQKDISQYYKETRIKQQTYPQFYNENHNLAHFLSIYSFYTTIYYPPPMCWRLTTYDFDPNTVDPSFSHPDTNPYHYQGYVMKYTSPPPPATQQRMLQYGTHLINSGNGPTSLPDGEFGPQGPSGTVVNTANNNSNTNPTNPSQLSTLSLLPEINQSYPIYTHYWSVVHALLFHPSEELRVHVFGPHYKMVISKLDDTMLNFLYRLDLNSFVEKYRYQLFFDPIQLEMLTLLNQNDDLNVLNIDGSINSVVVTSDSLNGDGIANADGKNENYHPCVDLRFFDDRIFESYYLSRHHLLEEQALASEMNQLESQSGITNSNAFGLKRRGMYGGRVRQWLDVLVQKKSTEAILLANQQKSATSSISNKSGSKFNDYGDNDDDDDVDDGFLIDDDETDDEESDNNTKPATNPTPTATTAKAKALSAKEKRQKEKDNEKALLLQKPTETCLALPTDTPGCGSALRSISLVWYLVNTVHLTIDDLSVLLQGIQNPNFCPGDEQFSPYPDQQPTPTPQTPTEIQCDEDGNEIPQQPEPPQRPNRDNAYFLTSLPFDVFNDLNQSILMFGILRRWDENLLTFLINTFTLDHFFTHYDVFGRNAYYYMVMAGLTRGELPQLWNYIRQQENNFRMYPPIFDKPSSWDIISTMMVVNGKDEEFDDEESNQSSSYTNNNNNNNGNDDDIILPDNYSQHHHEQQLYDQQEQNYENQHQ